MGETGDGTWGHLADSQHLGLETEQPDFTVVPKERVGSSLYTKCERAAHCMIYAKYDERVFGIYKPRAAVLMQMRFDGYLGFPGGLVDEGESVLSGLNRELVEEMGVDLGRVAAREADHVVTHFSPAKNLCLHFYATETTLDEIRHVEANAWSAQDHGTEALGVVRVPLYTMGDGFRGFPCFLRNAFAGNAREQLLHTLVHLGLMSGEEVELAREAQPPTLQQQP